MYCAYEVVSLIFLVLSNLHLNCTLFTISSVFISYLDSKSNLFYPFYTNMKVIHFILETILLVLAIISQYKNNIISTMHDIFYIVSIFVILCTLCDLIIRLLDQNWKDGAMKALKSSFKYSTVIVLCIPLYSYHAFLIIQSTNKEYSLDYNWKPNSVACICLLCFVLIPFIIYIFSQQKMNKGIISFMNGLDYGTGMAYSFYYGYLRIILPSTGTASKGLLEKIENFEDVHNVSVAIKKLFILIPSSSYISPDLKELSYGWIESTQELEKEIRDRAGVKRRSYHNSIYKIYPDGKQCATPEYIVLEGATPILTYFEVQKHFHPESAIYKTYSEEIIRAFYVKLKELIYTDPACKDLCELIYYKDQDSNGKKVNVAKIILERVETLKNSN